MALQLNPAQKKFLTLLLTRAALLGFFGFFILLVGAMGVYWAPYHQAPSQPIAFPHTIHAGTLRLPCTHCHLYVDKSPRAGVPTLDICMACHRTIATTRPEIVKLREHVKEERPVAWDRVNALPDFIYFNHKRHVRAGIDCFACHGAVATMTRVRQVRSLQMGWCVTCHRSNGAPTDCTTCHK